MAHQEQIFLPCHSRLKLTELLYYNIPCEEFEYILLKIMIYIEEKKHLIPATV